MLAIYFLVRIFALTSHSKWRVVFFAFDRSKFVLNTRIYQAIRLSSQPGKPKNNKNTKKQIYKLQKHRSPASTGNPKNTLTCSEMVLILCQHAEDHFFKTADQRLTIKNWLVKSTTYLHRLITFNPKSLNLFFFPASGKVKIDRG